MPAQDLLIERLGLQLRLRVQFALEDRNAHLVLAQGRAPAPELNVQTHERSVHGFLQRIEDQQPQGRLHGGLGSAVGALLGQEPGEGSQGKLVQALALSQ